MEAVELAGVERRGRSVLVTGAHGLLGAWLVKALLEAEVRVVVDPPRRAGRLGAEHAGPRRTGSTPSRGHLPAGLIERALAEYEVDSVFHLAAQTLVGTANRAPLSTFETNIRGTWLLLEACRRHGVAERDRRLLGQGLRPPARAALHRGARRWRPRFPYDVSKAAADLIARSYWHTFGLPVAVTRFANLYGGGDTNRSRLVPEAIGAALAGRAPVIRSDGSPERDFLYVEDAAAAYLAIWRALLAGQGRGEAFNAGGGTPHRVGDVVALICRLAGSSVDARDPGPGRARTARSTASGSTPPSSVS